MDIVRVLCDRIYSGVPCFLPLIAAENVPSQRVLNILGHPCGSRTIEGYPGNRYHSGAEYIDKLEDYAIARARILFGAQYANVQPHSCTQANHAAIFALLKPGQRILSMSLKSGGHLSHGTKSSIISGVFEVSHYGVDPITGLLDYEAVRSIASAVAPKLIIAGSSSYPRSIDFLRFRKVANEVGAYLLADVSHIAGIIAASLHMSPIDHAHLTTMSTYKTLRGPRGGLILSGKDHERLIGKNTLRSKVNRTLFPGVQGTPRIAEIAAKAICLEEASEKSFVEYQSKVLNAARLMAKCFTARGAHVVSGGTDTHMILVDCTRSYGINGMTAEKVLEVCGLLLNRNVIPNDTGSPNKPDGIRLGVNSLVTLGYDDDVICSIVEVIDQVLRNTKGMDNCPYFECSAGIIEEARRTVHDFLRLKEGAA